MSSYKYLGIVFASSGSFTCCQFDLYKRALKAYFKLVKCFGNIKPKIHTLIHLYDHTVKPVLLYACEIWGTINTDTSSVKRPDYCIENFFNKMFCEKMHIKFLKYICGVHKKASNQAIVGELGRFPMYFDVIKSCFKYLRRILDSPVDSLLRNAVYENNVLYDNNKSSWTSSIHYILNKLNIQCSIHDKNIVSIVTNKLHEQFKYSWCSTLSDIADKQCGKLRTYSLFKTRFCREKYFSVIRNPQVLKCFTNFRISSHSLAIETGRYTKTQVNERKCSVCKSDCVEDEFHFTFDCTAYQHLRKPFIESMNTLYKNFINLCNREKFIWLMSNECDSVIENFANYIYSCSQLRKVGLS